MRRLVPALSRRVPAGLLLALLAGLALRLALWGRLPRLGLISDEGEYLAAADWLAHGRGFDWYQGYFWTRAPLYPLFVAAHLRLFADAVAPIYVTQAALSLLNVALVYVLARHVGGHPGGYVDPHPGGYVDPHPGGYVDPPLLARHPGGYIDPHPGGYIDPPLLARHPGGYTDPHVGGYTDPPLPARHPGGYIDPHPGGYIDPPLLAALLMALYFPFALYTQALLSETLFLTLLLGAFVALAGWAARGRRAWLLGAGALFGLATLTRSLTLPFIPIAALWLIAQKPPTTNQEPAHRPTTRLSALGARCYPALLFGLTAALTILPWTVYNSVRLYGGPVLVDTSGAFNILLGGRTAYDGNRNDAATRDFALALLDPSLSPAERARKLHDQRDANGQLLRAGACLYRQADPALLAALARPVTRITQYQRQQLMSREGMCLIAARPLAFVQKSLAELIDLFQINPTGAERFMSKFSSGRLPPWYPLALFALDDSLYVLVLPLAVLGWALLRRLPGRSLQALIGLWWLYNLAVAPLLFAINRFRLPLLPFAFVFAAYALSALPRGGWRRLPRAYGWLCAALAALLLLVAATPYAYLEPRAPGADSRWASYLGPYPSSLDITLRTLGYRQGYLRAEQLRAALQAGRLDDARALLGAGLSIVRADGVATDAHTIAAALLDGHAGDPAGGSARLPSAATIVAARDVEAAVALGDLLRSSGDLAGARKLLGQTFVDDNNPVEWAWEWLRPARIPNNNLDIAGNLDLGYISGCYLGEGDPQAQGNFRWCSDGARIRFPQAGTGTPQLLRLRADGRGWAGYAAAPPTVQVVVNNQVVGTFTPVLDAPAECTVVLPPAPPGADVLLTLRTATFVPDAGRYIRQQGKAVVGQVQRLGLRLDWVRLEAAP
jgi:hypothetical protein